VSKQQNLMAYRKQLSLQMLETSQTQLNIGNNHNKPVSEGGSTRDYSTVNSLNIIHF